MAHQLVAGQTVAADYTLLHPIDKNGTSAESWLAQQISTQERVQIDFLQDDLDPERTRNELAHHKALIHPNVLLGQTVVNHESLNLIVSNYRRGLLPLDFDQPLTQLWPQLKSIIEALEYAHSLGFTHGSIAAEKCCVSDDGTPYLTGFGLSKSPSGSIQTDIHDIAQLIYICLTGAPYNNKDKQPTTVVEPDLANLLASMLSEDPSQRPVNFAALLELVEKSQQQTLVEPASFFRPAPVEAPTNVSTGDSVHKLPRERSVVSLPMTLLALAVIVVMAGALFFVLPADRTVATPTTTAPSSTPSSALPAIAEPKNEEPKPPALAPLELALLEELKAKGIELAAELLRIQVDVEDIGGRLWAGERYDKSTELGINGDQAYREEQYQLAADQYTEGLQLLQTVLDEAQEVLEKNLVSGREALITGDHVTAIRSFQVATKIRPNDSGFRAELLRAEKLEQVVRFSADAELSERIGDLDKALEGFRSANTLDELWQPAANGIDRISSLISRRLFQDEMSQGFEAIAAEDFELAAQAFQRAQTILPDSREPLDGLQQIELAKVQSEIEGLTSEVSTLEQEGNWLDAIPLYEKILDISPGLSAASNGLANARQQADLKATLNQYIQQPQLMQSDEGLKEARRALVTATQSGGGFKSQARELSHLLSLARIEVDVLLTSDQRTDVTVYQVGRYGTIEQAELSLIPGIYTFVGKRKGYRDVYQEVHIKGDINPITVDIRCSEKI